MIKNNSYFETIFYRIEYAVSCNVENNNLQNRHLQSTVVTFNGS
jgi:hypothetical protein